MIILAPLHELCRLCVTRLFTGYCIIPRLNNFNKTVRFTTSCMLMCTNCLCGQQVYHDLYAGCMSNWYFDVATVNQALRLGDYNSYYSMLGS